MASLIRRGKGGNYQVRFLLGGERFTVAVGADEEQAHRAKIRVEETLDLLRTGRLVLPEGANKEQIGLFVVSGGAVSARPRIATTTAPPTIKQVVDAYFAAIPEGAKEANSLATERIHLAHFVRLLGADRPFAELGPSELQAYVASRSREKPKRGTKKGTRVSPATIKKELATFGQLWRFAKRERIVSMDLERADIRTPKGDAKARFQTRAEIQARIARGGMTVKEQGELWDCCYLTRTELGEFLEHARDKAGAPAWLYPALALAVYTGARRSEILRAEVADVDLAEGKIDLREKKRRRDVNISFRRVDIHPKLAAILREWLSRHPGGRYLFVDEERNRITGKQTWGAWESLIKGSAWANLRGWHTLRHSFASLCAAQGLPDATIDAWMGHVTREMRERYRHLAPTVTAQHMAGLF